MHPLVSILIPVYNAEEWLAETLECAVDQTWPRKEIIVVDDGSSDHSLPIARQYESRSVKVISQENRGACAARNRALEEAQGDYIQYLDADDIMDMDKIEVQMHRFREEPPGTIASTPWYRFYQEPGDFMHDSSPSWRDFSDPLEWLVWASNEKAMFPPLAWLTPRSVIEMAGRWNEDLLINQDGEYFARVLLQSSKIAFCPETRVFYRSGLSGSVSQRHSPSVLSSHYLAAKLINERMLRRENSKRVREACAHRLQKFVQKAYPEVPRLVRQAEMEIERLGGADVIREGRPIYQHLSRLIGWKAAKHLRRLYYRVRYNRKV